MINKLVTFFLECVIFHLKKQKKKANLLFLYHYVKCVLFDIQFNDTLIELPLRYVRKIQLPLFSDATGKFCSTFQF